MKAKSLEERLAALEREVVLLRQALANGGDPLRDPSSTYGMFTGDEVMKRIDAAALEYREKDRAKARRTRKSRQKAKA